MSRDTGLSEDNLIARITELENELERQQKLSEEKDGQLQTWLLTVEKTLQETLDVKDSEIAQLRAEVEYYKGLVPPEHEQLRHSDGAASHTPLLEASSLYFSEHASSISEREATSPSSVYDSTPSAYSLLEKLRRDISAFSPSASDSIGVPSSLHNTHSAPVSLLPVIILPSVHSSSADVPESPDHALGAGSIPASTTILDLVATFNKLSLSVRKPAPKHVPAVADAPTLPPIALPHLQLVAASPRCDSAKRRPVHRRLRALASTDDHLFTPGSPAASNSRIARSKFDRARCGSPQGLRLVVRTPYWREAMGCRTPVSPCWGIGKGNRG